MTNVEKSKLITSIVAMIEANTNDYKEVEGILKAALATTSPYLIKIEG